MRIRLAIHVVLAAVWLAVALYVFFSSHFDVWGQHRWSAGVLALALMLWNLVRGWLVWRMSATGWPPNSTET
jgi:hypothetical protein